MSKTKGWEPGRLTQTVTRYGAPYTRIVVRQGYGYRGQQIRVYHQMFKGEYSVQDVVDLLQGLVLAYAADGLVPDRADVDAFIRRVRTWN